MLYASGRQGWADAELNGPRKDLSTLFDLVLTHVKAPALDAEAPFAMVASILEYDQFLGRVLTGRIEQGRAASTCRCASCARTAPSWKADASQNCSASAAWTG